MVRLLRLLRRNARARACASRGAVAGGSRVGRPLRSVQARLRALRLGKHPVTGATIDAALPPSSTGGSLSGRTNDGQVRVDRERSRSRRRAAACDVTRAGGGGGGQHVGSTTAAGMAATATAIAVLPPCVAAVAMKTPAATAMAGAQTTINNQLKSATVMTTEGGWRNIICKLP